MKIKTRVLSRVRVGVKTYQVRLTVESQTVFKDIQNVHALTEEIKSTVKSTTDLTFNQKLIKNKTE